MISGLVDRTEAQRLNRAGDAAARAKDYDKARELYGEALSKDRYACQDDIELLAESPKAFRARVQLRDLIRVRLATMARAAKRYADEEYVPDPSWAPKVFVYWGQGFENAPDIVKRCHAELRRHHTEDELVVLTDENISEWVDIPADLLSSIGENRTAYSDLLRVELLAKYGGIWIDATCLPTTRLTSHFDELVGDAGFFAFETNEKTISSWFLAARPGNYLTHLVRDSMRLYWRVFDKPITYFYLHYIFRFLHTMDRRSDRIWSKVLRPKYDPRTFGRILKRPAVDYDPAEVLRASIVHKLSYKRAPEDVGPGTVFYEVVHGAFLEPAHAALA